jgi:hypothetical protein
MLRYYEVNYIMLPRDEELGEQMRHRPDSFTEVNIPGGQYVLYEVDLPNLGTDALVPANDLLLSGDFDAATAAYEEALERAQETGDEDALFLSYLGLGQSYTGRGSRTRRRPTSSRPRPSPPRTKPHNSSCREPRKRQEKRKKPEPLKSGRSNSRPGTRT